MLVHNSLRLQAVASPVDAVPNFWKFAARAHKVWPCMYGVGSAALVRRQ